METRPGRQNPKVVKTLSTLSKRNQENLMMPCNIPFRIKLEKCEDVDGVARMILGADETLTQSYLLCVLGASDRTTIKLEAYYAPVENWPLICKNAWFSCGLQYIDTAKGYKFNHKNVNILASAIGAMKSLTSLDLVHNNLRVEGVKTLVDSRAFNGSLSNINLAANELCGPIGTDNYTTVAIEALSMAIRNNLLTSISLASNQLCGHRTFTTEGIGILSKAIHDGGSSGSLTSLDLGNNNMRTEGITTLVDSGAFNGALTSLDLSMNELEAEAAKVLASAINNSGSLKSIDLRSNELGADGAKALVDGEAFMGSLTECDLRENLLDDQSKQILRDSVRSRPSFKLHL